MSLLEAAMQDFTILNKIKSDDGYGGTITHWGDGAKIKAAVVFNSSNETKIAQALGVTGNYTIITKKNITLDYHDVLRREFDGKIFRITSDGDDLFSPDTANLDMRNVSAEEWKLDG